MKFLRAREMYLTTFSEKHITYAHVQQEHKVYIN